MLQGNRIAITKRRKEPSAPLECSPLKLDSRIRCDSGPRNRRQHGQETARSRAPWSWKANPRRRRVWHAAGKIKIEKPLSSWGSTNAGTSDDHFGHFSCAERCGTSLPL